MEDRAQMIRFYSCLAECYKREVKIVDVQDDDLCANRCWEMHETGEDNKKVEGKNEQNEKKD